MRKCLTVIPWLPTDLLPRATRGLRKWSRPRYPTRPVGGAVLCASPGVLVDGDGLLLHAPVVGLATRQPYVGDAALDPVADVRRVAGAVARHREPGAPRDDPRVHRAEAEARVVAERGLAAIV